MYASSVVNRKRRKPRKTMIPTAAASTTERRCGTRRMKSPIEETLAAKRREGSEAGHACRRENAHASRLSGIIRGTRDARQPGPDAHPGRGLSTFKDGIIFN